MCSNDRGFLSPSRPGASSLTYKPGPSCGERAGAKGVPERRRIQLPEARGPTPATLPRASLLNLCEVSVTHTKWARGPEEVLMTKHRTNYWVRGCHSARRRRTASTMRSYSPWTNGTTLFKGLTVDANELPPPDFDDRWSAMFALPPQRTQLGAGSTSAKCARYGHWNELSSQCPIVRKLNSRVCAAEGPIWRKTQANLRGNLSLSQRLSATGGSSRSHH
jgi:hypothetical protein